MHGSTDDSCNAKSEEIVNPCPAAGGGDRPGEASANVRPHFAPHHPVRPIGLRTYLSDQSVDQSVTQPADEGFDDRVSEMGAIPADDVRAWGAHMSPGKGICQVVLGECFTGECQ